MIPQLDKILLVEDDPRDVELTLEAFEENNLVNAVVVARDGEEALDYLFRRGKFADRPGGDPVVIFLDLKLPKVDGLEVLKEIKADEDLKLIPVVIFSSSIEEQELIESYKLGINAYVVKPVDFNKFIEAARGLGLFWGILNKPPIRKERP